MSDKIKVLAYCDSPTCATGFGTVSRNIFEALYKTGRYQIDILGINYWGDPHTFPYRIWPTAINDQHDPYGKKKVANMMAYTEDFKNHDIVFFLQDTFILDFIPSITTFFKNNNLARKTICYYPVDGTPKPTWIDNIKGVDYLVAYSQFGKTMTQQVSPGTEVPYIIPHGANVTDFHPLDKNTITNFRKRYFNKHSDKFIVCFPPGHMVQTDIGLKDIADIVIDDVVLTHKNRFKKVLNIFKRDYVGDLIEISDGQGGTVIRPTDNHPIFAVKREDVLCKYFNSVKGKNNYVCRPKKEDMVYSRPCKSCSYYTNYVFKEDKIKEYKASDLSIGDFLIYPVDMTINNKKIEILNSNNNKNTKQLPQYVNLCPEVMLMFGLWLADGCYLKQGDKYVGINFSQKSDRRDIIDAFKLGIKMGFGIDCSEYISTTTAMMKNKTYISEKSSVNCSSTNLAELFYRLFGEYSHSKFISDEFNTLDPTLQLQLCVGYILGDGCVRNSSHSRSSSFTIVGQSLNVMKSIQKMFLRNKIITSIFKDNNTNNMCRLIGQGNDLLKFNEILNIKSISVNRVKDVRNRFFINDYLFSPIKSVNKVKYEGIVHNIEVEDDNSYTINGIATHNCNVNRNQQRKDIPRTIQAFVEFRKQVPNSILYLHMAMEDQGWNLVEVCKSFGLSISEDVIFPQNFGPNQGYPRNILNLIYNASDIVVSTTTGEGAGLSYLESMATKTPVIMPNNTALTEFITSERGWLSDSGTNPSLLTVLPRDNEVIRPLVNVNDMVDKMVQIYKNPKEAQRRAQNAYEWITTEMDWQGKIGQQWVTLFDKAYDDLKNNKVGKINTVETSNGITTETF